MFGVPIVKDDHIRPYNELKDLMTLEEYQQTKAEMLNLWPVEGRPGCYWNYSDHHTINRDKSCIFNTPLKISLEHFTDPNYVPDYGVVDTVDQFFELFGAKLEAAPYKVVVSFSQQIKEAGDKGFRWHKHGSYYGTKNIKCEYFGDEPEIDSVILFSIYRLL